MKQDSGDKKGCNFEQKLLNQDRFGQSFTLRLEEGRETLRSRVGALCSVMLIILLISYAGYKVSVLEGKKSIDILQAVRENHFDDTHEFTNQQGLNIAAMVVNPFNPATHQLIDPSFGRIKFSRSHWRVNEQGKFQLDFTELESHVCTSEELGLSGSNSAFWPINEKQEDYVKNFKHMYLCVDPSGLAV